MGETYLRFKVRNGKPELLYFGTLDRGGREEKVVVDAGEEGLMVSFLVKDSRVQLVDKVLDILREEKVDLTVAQRIVDVFNAGKRKLNVTYTVSPRVNGCSVTLDITMC